MITKINQNHRFLKIYRIKLANPSKFLTSDCEAVVRSQDASQGLRSSRAPCGAGRMACWKKKSPLRFFSATNQAGAQNGMVK
jgi:hypothetical protein